MNMNLKQIIREEVKRQLSESAGWHKRHPSLTDRGFGQTYSKLYAFLKALKIFIEHSNVTNNEEGKLELADSKLIEAYEIAPTLVNDLKMMITEMGNAVDNMKQPG